VYRFGLFPQHKIQPAQKWPEWPLVKACLLERGVSTVFFQPVIFYWMYFWSKRCGGIDVSAQPTTRARNRRGCFCRLPQKQVAEPIPSAWVFLWQTAAWFLANDMLFYWLHRLFHTRYLYGRFHKQHHM
jgi:sterol desaturase/sphingolipid hydroxylase (fatty acid hydroxylase superfamily)